MADSDLPPFRRAATGTPVDTMAPRATEVPIEDDDALNRVRRLRQRFLYAWHHPLWTRWRQEAKEDLDFVSGVGQWDEVTRKKLESQGRPVLTINQVRPVIQTVVGYERSARLEPKPVPEAIGSSAPDERIIENVQVLGRLMKRVASDQEADFVQSEGFKDGAIGGLGAWKVDIDYADDWIHGRPALYRIKPGEFLYDPDCQRYDLEDAREVFWHKLVPIETLEAQYPEADIGGALALLEPDAPGITHDLPPRDPYDGYRNVSLDSTVTLWDAERREVRVVETWFQVWEDVHLLIDQRRNTVDPIPEEPETIRLAHQLAAADPDAVRVATKKRRVWMMSVFLPATFQELEVGNPFENDVENCPFVQFLAYREGDEILGLIRNLKDPQREVNKRRSAIIDNVSKHGSSKWFARRGAMENPEFLEVGIDAGAVGWLKTNPAQERPVEVSPPPMPAWVVQQEEIAKGEIRDTSMVNQYLQGKAQAQESGKKVLALQQQGQVGVSELFDNYRRSRRLIWKRVGKRIQQTFTAEMVVRLEDEAGGSEWVTLNQKRVTEEGHVLVERDIPSLRWDVEITESATTPTARAAMLAGLLEFANQFPDYKDALADLIVEVSDFSGRRELVQRIKMIQRAKGIVPQPGAPALAAPAAARPNLPARALATQGVPAGGLLLGGVPPG